MGDIADWHIDMMFDAIAQGEEDYCYEGKVCRYCGESGFSWRKVKGKWRLFDRQHQMHSCLSQSNEGSET